MIVYHGTTESFKKKTCGYEVEPTEWSYSMDRIDGARKYCIEKGYTGI